MHFSVGNLPTSGQTQGITALPTVDGSGVLAQFNEKMWKFTCDSSSCSWNKESQELDPPVFHSVAMHLPILPSGHSWCETPKGLKSEGGICVNILSDKRCNKKKEKCGKKSFADQCKKTCGLC